MWEPLSRAAAVAALLLSGTVAIVAQSQDPQADAAATLVPGEPTLISGGPLGEAPDRSCGGHPRLSGDGRVVSFTCAATNLMPGNVFNTHLYTYDRAARRLLRESITPTGAPAAGNTLFAGVLSDTGRFIAFVSDAAGLVPGVTGRQLYVRDRVLGITKVFRSPNGRWQFDEPFPPEPFITGDGRYVMMLDQQTTLYVFDTESTGLISRERFGPDDTAVRVNRLSVSGDGRYVCFSFFDVAAGAVPTIFVRDRLTGVTTAESGATGSWAPAVSRDGRFVAWRSSVPGDRRMFLRNRVSGETQVIPYTGDVIAVGPLPSADGRYLSYQPVGGTFSPFYRAEIYDVVTGQRVRVSGNDVYEITPVVEGVVAFRAAPPYDQAVFIAQIPPAPLPVPTLWWQRQSGNVVGFFYAAPFPTPLGYRLEAGTAPGISNVGIFTIQTPFAAAPLDPGITYYVRARAIYAAGISDSSNEVIVSLISPPPSNPTDLRATVSGGTVILSWQPPIVGSPPARYRVEVGSAPGLSNLAMIDLANATTRIVASNVPSGSYFVRVRAANDSGLSSPSGEVLVVVR